MVFSYKASDVGVMIAGLQNPSGNKVERMFVDLGKPSTTPLPSLYNPRLFEY
jgi:hypothetical protein